MSDVIKDMASAIADSQKEAKTSAYDVTATVLRVEGDTTWIHIDGGAEETPVQSTINSKTGDLVKVRVSGGTAWITGNLTAPPTDDKKAEEASISAVKANTFASVAKTIAETALKASEKATKYLTAISDTGVLVHRADDTETVNGVQIDENIEIIRNGDTVTTFGEDVVIGASGGFQTTITKTGFRVGNEDDAVMTLGVAALVIGALDIIEVLASDSYTLTYDPVGSINVYIETSFDFTVGTSATKSNSDLSISYDGAKTFKFNVFDGNPVTVQFTYSRWLTGIANSIGSRKGLVGIDSTIIGESLYATRQYSVAIGAYNKDDSTELTIFSIGNGESDTDRSNALEVDLYGNVYASGSYYTNAKKILTTKDYTLTFGSTLWNSGYYVDKDISSDVTAYGKAISATVITVPGNVPCYVYFLYTGSRLRVFSSFTSTKSQSVTVRVTYSALA